MPENNSINQKNNYSNERRKGIMTEMPFNIASIEKTFKLFNRPSGKTNKISLLMATFFICSISIAQFVPYKATVNTYIIPPVNPNIINFISKGNIKPKLFYKDGQGQSADVKVFGKIESLSPKPFTISLNPSYSLQQRVTLYPSVTLELTPAQVADAFGNFNESTLILSGIELNSLKDANNNLKLPEGVYRICFYAKYANSDGNLGNDASDPNQGCAFFNICYKAAPPQFTQPVNNFNIQTSRSFVRPSSPVIFTWTPPNATCGLNLSTINYDFEIREMHSFQTITDAINNPPVFIKKLLPSATFLLDTILYKQVLQHGKQYMIRVKAQTTMNAPIEIDNNGFSRPEVFIYGDTVSVPLIKTNPVTSVPKKTTHSTIATSTIKGKAVWSFKKVEEELPPQYDKKLTAIKIPEAVNTITNKGSNKPMPGSVSEAKNSLTRLRLAIDPNLNIASSQIIPSVLESMFAENLTDRGEYIISAAVSGDGKLIEKSNLRIPAEYGKDIHPLAGARVFLKGVKVKKTVLNQMRVSADLPPKATTVSLSKQLGLARSGSPAKNSFAQTINTASTIASSYLMTDENDQEEDLIGSGITDAEGNFIINFIDPKFRNITKYSKLHIVIEHSDFEKSEQYVNVKAPDENGDINLGEMQLLAKTYRFTPYVDYLSSLFAENLKIEFYCPANIYNENPHYAYMISKKGQMEKKVIAGKEYIRITSVQNGETINKLFYQHGSTDNFILKIAANKKEDYITYMGVVPVRFISSGNANPMKEVDESKMVISIKKKYTIKAPLPYIHGTAQANLGDGLIPVSGAVVTVSFDTSKLKETPQAVTENTNREGGATPIYGTNKISDVNTGKNKNSISQKTNQSILNNPGTSNAHPIVDAIAKSIAATSRYSTITDEAGNYRIDNLPVLNEGENFTVQITSSKISVEKKQDIHSLQRGDSSKVNFDLNPEIVTVTGTVVDHAGVPLPFATIRWKSNPGNPKDAAENGLFVLNHIPGNDSIIISRFGYVTKTIAVEIKSQKPKQENQRSSKENKMDKIAGLDEPVSIWASTLEAQSSVKMAIKQRNSFSPALFGYAVNSSSEKGIAKAATSFTTVYTDLFKDLDLPAGFIDLGNVGYLEKSVAKINFKVVDFKTKAPVSGAIISIVDSVDVITNASGEKLFIGGGEGIRYTVKGPAGSDYVIQSGEISSPPADGTVTNVNISLDHGIKLTGKVTSKGKNINEAEVFLDGKDFITTKTTADGTYTLIIPEGENRVKATKQNYVGKSINKQFTKDEVENFDLEDGNGKNISKLLGFDIELESQIAEGTGEKWTGSFIKIKSNSVFSVAGNTKIKFTGIKVTFDASGNPIVIGNEVKTDATEIEMKLFGYVPVKIKGTPQIRVRKDADGKGAVEGKIEVCFNQIQSTGGILFDSYSKPLLIPINTSIDKDVPIFISDGSSPVNMGFALSYSRAEIKKAADKAVTEFQPIVDKAKGNAKTALQTKLNELKKAASDAAAYASGSGNIPLALPQYAAVKLYGFGALLNLAKFNIDPSGLDMSGMVVSPDLPIISSMVFDIEKLKVGTDFSIKALSLAAAANLKFNIVDWSAEINSVVFNMNGFKLSGKIEIEVPKSPKTTLQFANLSIGNSNLYGGSFTFPEAGVNVFDIIQLQSGSSPISFGEVGNTGVYRIGGSAKFSFKKLFSETIEIPYFQVQTNGKLAIQVPLNKSLNAGFAKFTLNSIAFNAIGSIPQIDVNGQFSVDVKLIKFTTGNIHFKPSGFTVDNIGLGLDIPGTKVNVDVDIKENGFAGRGSLSIVGTPIKASINFHYFNTPNNGVDLGAAFVADTKIPIGIIMITKVGGGFTYKSNPEFFSVTITGGASITGFETAVSLDPISITVESGPKLMGEAHLKVATLDVAKAALVIDIPNEYFALGVVADFSPLPDLLKAHIQGDFIISGKRSDSYFFLGCGMDVNLLGLIHSRGVFAIGAGVNDAKTRDKISYYMKDAPDQYLSNGSFSGLYIKAMAEAGIQERDAVGFDVKIAALKLWLYTRSDNMMIANFNNANFSISSSMKFEGGIRAEALGFSVTQTAKACAEISGGFSSSQGWNFAARASGEAMLQLGDDCNCNEICGPVWPGAKICVGAGASIKYESRRGGLKDMSLFLGSPSICN